MTGKHAKPDDDRDWLAELVGWANADAIMDAGWRPPSYVRAMHAKLTESRFAPDECLTTNEFAYALSGPFTPEQVDLITGGEPAEGAVCGAWSPDRSLTCTNDPGHKGEHRNDFHAWLTGTSNSPTLYRNSWAGGEPAAAPCDGPKGHDYKPVAIAQFDGPPVMRFECAPCGGMYTTEVSGGGTIPAEPQFAGGAAPGPVWQDRNPKPPGATT